jgi:hypothetical protein
VGVGAIGQVDAGGPGSDGASPYRIVLVIVTIPPYVFLVGSFFRLVLAKSSSCFSDIDSAICFDAPLRVDLLVSPRLADNAAPAAICCFLDFAGILSDRDAGEERTY